MTGAVHWFLAQHKAEFEHEIAAVELLSIKFAVHFLCNVGLGRCLSVYTVTVTDAAVHYTKGAQLQ